MVNDSSKHFYAFIKKRMRSKTAEIVLTDANNNKIVSDEQKAQLLADYFSSVFVTDNGSKPTLALPSNRILSSFLICPSDVFAVCKTLKPSFSLSPDGIPQAIFKECYSEITEPLAHIFNISLRLGAVPQVWKRSFVTAVPKTRNASKPSDYRPISITCTPCKLMERCIKNGVSS